MTEKIIYKGRIIALIIRKSFKKEGITFFSSANYPLQLGAMYRPKSYQVIPHIHKPIKRLTRCTQEVLFIQSGEVRIDFYSPKKVFLKSRKLCAGDIVLFASAGHGIEFIKKGVIFEVKNGPFIQGADKEKFLDKRKQK